MLATVQVGLRGAGDASLPVLARGPALDYSSLPPGMFGPLTSNYIARVLGLSLPGDVRAPGLLFEGESPAGRPLAPGTGTFAARAPQPRIVIDHPLSNDRLSEAFPIETPSFTAKSDTRSATRDLDEPADCGPIGGTVWYRYQAEGDLGLVASTFGSDYATALGVFRQTDDGTGFEAVACDIDPAGNAQTVFRGERDALYYLRVAGPSGGGALVFNLDRLGETRRISSSRSGKPGNGDSDFPLISPNGRYVAFRSVASDLVRDDKNTITDVFVHDLASGVTTIESVSSEGKQPTIYSDNPSVSDNGRYVVFSSYGNMLVPDDTNRYVDVFVRDRLTRKTTRVSVSSSGAQGRRPAEPPAKHCLPFAVGDLAACYPGTPNAHAQIPSVSISADGRYVAFNTPLWGLRSAPDTACTTPASFNLNTSSLYLQGRLPDVPLAPGEPATKQEIWGHRTYCRGAFVHDRVEHTTTEVSVSSEGKPGFGDSSSVQITPDGRYVVFASNAANLVPGDTNHFRDVFVHDRLTGKTTRESVSRDEKEATGNSGGWSVVGHATISADGRYVAFVSGADNLVSGDLVPDDTNQLADTFVRDRLEGTTIRIPPRPPSGLPPEPPSEPTLDPPPERTAERTFDLGASHASISADGRYVAFTAGLSETGGDPTPPAGQEDPKSSRATIQHVYVYDLVTDTTVQVDVATNGEEGDRSSQEPAISADGRYVVFFSDSTNLVSPDDTPLCLDHEGEEQWHYKSASLCYDVFVHELAFVR